ncbi:MAG: hypothetical protein IJG02_09305, partial [Thermoguttaceae bacterium]|nr:hypothetical protein [Thermoguttaceae bacterium]
EDTEETKGGDVGNTDDADAAGEGSAPDQSAGKKPAARPKAKPKGRQTSDSGSDDTRPRSPSPVTDEDLERADEAADDFYAPNK